MNSGGHSSAPNTLIHSFVHLHQCELAILILFSGLHPVTFITHFHAEVLGSPCGLTPRCS